jgi:hypothetical protein
MKDDERRMKSSKEKERNFKQKMTQTTLQCGILLCTIDKNRVRVTLLDNVGYAYFSFGGLFFFPHIIISCH